MSDTALDQSLGEGGERARGSVRETQAPGLGRVAVERRQFRIGVQLAHLDMDIVIDPLEKVENTRRIAAAVVGGKLLPKEALKEMLVDAEATIADRGRQR